MSFRAYDVALEIIQALREPLIRLERFDRELAAQARTAASSVALNLSEGRRRQGKDRFHLWRVAAGSNAEVRTALRVAVAWGFLDGRDVLKADELLDREQAMLWRLTQPRS